VTLIQTSDSEEVRARRLPSEISTPLVRAIPGLASWVKTEPMNDLRLPQHHEHSTFSAMLKCSVDTRLKVEDWLSWPRNMWKKSLQLMAQNRTFETERTKGFKFTLARDSKRGKTRPAAEELSTHFGPEYCIHYHSLITSTPQSGNKLDRPSRPPKTKEIAFIIVIQATWYPISHCLILMHSNSPAHHSTPNTLAPSPR
jgi:hypothetical protein